MSAMNSDPATTTAWIFMHDPELEHDSRASVESFATLFLSAVTYQKMILRRTPDRECRRDVGTKCLRPLA